MRRPAPRLLSAALENVVAALAPATPLAAVQHVWQDAVGEAIASEAQPVSERAGVLTIVCRSAVWAQELDLMAPSLLERLNAAPGGARVTALRVVATGRGIIA